MHKRLDHDEHEPDPTAAGKATAAEGGFPLHLLRLASPGFPVGAYSYSRGLEWAVHAGWVRDGATAADWILGILETTVTCVDGALFWRMAMALRAGDEPAFARANAWLAASRESRELQLEDRRMGEAMLALLVALGVLETDSRIARTDPPTFPGSFAIAAQCWDVPPAAGLRGLLWTIVEAQVAAASRLVPLGSVAAQKVLIEAVPAIERAAVRAAALDDEEIGNLSPALAMASAWHETQYSRLFRS